MAVEELAGTDHVDQVLVLLDRAESDRGVPLVDESERLRLEDLAAGRAERVPTWHSALARLDATAVGYAALFRPEASVSLATGDVAVDRRQAVSDTVLQALLAAATTLGERHGVGRLQLWLRDARDHELHLAGTPGYRVDRRLGILARPLDDMPPVVVPDGVVVDAFTEGDADAVVEVLAGAYAGTDDGGWTRADFDARRALGWFDPADLLVARDLADDRILGIHWTKQRGAGVGEVHNLAIHPDAQGRRLGGALLVAGLVHLREVGCHEVMLWVDLVNTRAVRLYQAYGFTTAWVDVALGRDLVRAT